MSGGTHFIGIGGTGLSAIARVLLERGETVSGSDQFLSAQANSLRALGATISEGHAAKNVNGANLVIRSSAIPDDNIEVQKAIEEGIPVLKRAEALGNILVEKDTLAIAGSHGKTTTSAMLAWLLVSLGQDPGYIVGSDLLNTGKNAASGASSKFVIEADEYDYMFLGLKPNIALITNVEHDHPDMFPTKEGFFSAFKSFVDNILPEGKLLYCIDDAGARELATHADSSGIDVFSYGIDTDNADYRGQDLEAISDGGTKFHFNARNSVEIKFELPLPGKHNVQNLVGALAAVDLLGLPISEAVEAVKNFQGTGRRFQIAGEAAGIIFVDDYAHHPSEISATISAARDRYPGKRLVVVWQAHTYSRTELLWDDFIESLQGVDEVYFPPVFSAREERPIGFDLESRIEKIDKANYRYCASLESCVDMLANSLSGDDVLLVLSAGDATLLNEKLLKHFEERS